MIHHSRPYVPPACPHCGGDLPGWREPVVGPWLIVKAVTIFAVAASGALFFLYNSIAIIVNWIDSNKTLLACVEEHGRWLMQLFGRIW